VFKIVILIVIVKKNILESPNGKKPPKPVEKMYHIIDERRDTKERINES